MTKIFKFINITLRHSETIHSTNYMNQMNSLTYTKIGLKQLKINSLKNIQTKIICRIKNIGEVKK